MSLGEPEGRKPRSQTPRTENINIRVTPHLRALIDRAASVEGKTRSEFMLDSAKTRAQDVLLDQTLFTLDNRKFAALLKMLDEPAPPSARLRTLLKRKASWET